MIQPKAPADPPLVCEPAPAQNLVEELHPSGASPSLETGRVERIEGATVLVWTGSQTIRAKRAPACIVAPEASDRVLLAHADGRTYVLAVLERDEDAAVRLSADGDLRIESTVGRVDITAPRGASVARRGEVSVVAAALKARSELADLAVSKLRVLGGELLAEVAHSKVVARTLESVAEVVQQTATRVTRVVTELEHARVGTLDLAAEKSATIHAENAMVTAKALVKVDGEAVQLG